jgi:hypothetical protein
MISQAEHIQVDPLTSSCIFSTAWRVVSKLIDRSLVAKATLNG